MQSNSTQTGPWNYVNTLHVGGLIAVGFPDDEHLLCLSWAGRGLYKLKTGAQVARDFLTPTEGGWFADDNLSAEGIGTYAGRRFSVAGLWGGTVWLATRDHYQLKLRTADGQIEDGWLISPDGIATLLPLHNVTENRAITFSPNGEWLILSTSSEVRLCGRAAL